MQKFLKENQAAIQKTQTDNPFLVAIFSQSTIVGFLVLLRYYRGIEKGNFSNSPLFESFSTSSIPFTEKDLILILFSPNACKSIPVDTVVRQWFDSRRYAQSHSNFIGWNSFNQIVVNSKKIFHMAPLS